MNKSKNEILNYIEDKNIKKILKTINAHLMVERPVDPLVFILGKLKNLKDGEGLSFFNFGNAEAIFDLINQNETSISLEDFEYICNLLEIKNMVGNFKDPKERITKERFSELMRECGN